MAPVKNFDGEGKPRKKGIADLSSHKHAKATKVAANSSSPVDEEHDSKSTERNTRKSPRDDVDEAALDFSLANDSKAIKELVSLIPPIHYQAPDADRQLSLSLKYMKKAGTTVSDKVERAKKNRKKGKFNPENTSDNEDTKEEDSDESESDQDSSEADDSAPAAEAKPALLPTSRVKSVAELRARLQARILQIRGGKPLPTENADDGGESKKRKREERKEEKKKKKKKDKDAKHATAPIPSPMPKDKGHGGKASEEDVVRYRCHLRCAPGTLSGRSSLTHLPICNLPHPSSCSPSV